MALKFPAIDPVAFEVGSFPIRWYALAYLCGFLLGWGYALMIAKRDDGRPDGQKIGKSHIDDFIPWAVFGVIFGGRLGYILFYQFEMYLKEPLEILKLWHGGMSFHGGAAGVILAMILYAYIHRLPLLRLTDIVCACVPIGLFFGRLANFVNGELWGRVTDVPWGFVFPYAGEEPRHPSQLYEAGLEGLLLWVILALMIFREPVRDRPGLVSGVFLLGYAAARSFVEFFREPDEQLGFLMGGLTMGQILCIPMALGGAYLIFRAFSHPRRKPA